MPGTDVLQLGARFSGDVNDMSASKLNKWVGRQTDELPGTHLFSLGDKFGGSVHDKSACKLKKGLAGKPMDCLAQIYFNWVIGFGAV